MECALCARPVGEQYVRVNVDQVFCLTDVASLLLQSVEGGYLEGNIIHTLQEFWQAAHDVTFSSIGY